MQGQGISARTRWAMTIGCAVSVANLYYVQPLLEQIAREFHLHAAQAGLAATLSQVGYAVGMFSIVPLGDLFERRRLILLSLLATAISLTFMAVVHTFPAVCLVSFMIGASTVTPQLIIPFAAHLAKPSESGRVVGFVISGLLLGILLARTVSGFIGAHLGWRSMFEIAAVMELLLLVALRFNLPESPSAIGKIPYPRLLSSLVELIREEPVLRISAGFGACIFGAFSAFWTTLAFYLAEPPFRYGPDVVGLFGLFGVAGALAAPLAGKFADQGHPRRSILVGIASVLASFLIFACPGLIAIVLGVIVMDAGVQANQVSNLSRIYSRRPEARSRMNTVYMTVYFLGGSAGSYLGSLGWTVYRWPGVCGVGALLSLIALALFVATNRTDRPALAEVTQPVSAH